MTPQSEWIWMGHQAHYWTRCEFHLATYVGNGYLVSTIGDEMHRGKKKHLDLTSSYFETLVFRARPYSTSDPITYDGCCQWVKIPGTDPVEQVYYDTAKEASEGHITICNKYAAMAPSTEEN